MAKPFSLLGMLLLGAALGAGLTAFVDDPPAPGSPQAAPGARVEPALVRPEALHPAGVSKRAAVTDGLQPPSTLRDIMMLDGDVAQSAALYTLAASAEVDEVASLLDEAATLMPLSERIATTSILYARFAELDPERALENALGGAAVTRRSALTAIFQIWARRNLDAALSAAAVLPMPDAHHAASAILSARDDLPASELKRIEVELGARGLSGRVIAQRLAAEAEDDPRGAWEHALRAGDGATAQLITVASVWGGQDPLSALGSVQDIADRQLRRQLTQAVARSWALRDPEAVVFWALSQPDGGTRSEVTNLAVDVLASRNPERAFDLALGLEGPTRPRTIMTVLNRWAERDAETAAARLLELDEPTIMIRGVQGIAARFARQDLTAAIDWSRRLSGDARVQATITIAGTGGRLAPGETADWIETIDDARERTFATQALIPQWLRADRDAALAYYRALPQSIRNGTANAMFGTPGVDRDTAEALYARMTDPNLRRQAAQQLYEMFQGVDPTRAARYLDEGARPPISTH